MLAEWEKEGGEQGRQWEREREKMILVKNVSSLTALAVQRMLCHLHVCEYSTFCIPYVLSEILQKSKIKLKIIMQMEGNRESHQCPHVFTDRACIFGLFTDLPGWSFSTYGYSSFTSYSILTWQNSALPLLLMFIGSRHVRQNWLG